MSWPTSELTSLSWKAASRLSKYKSISRMNVSVSKERVGVALYAPVNARKHLFWMRPSFASAPWTFPLSVK